MLVKDNVVYRNLQEQVLQNQLEIKTLKEQGVVADLGIKVMNAGTPFSSPTELPEEYDGEYGDGYIVGTLDGNGDINAPYYLYVWSRGVDSGYWFDWGELNAPSVVPGPAGPQGEQGDPGTRGSLWYSQSGAPANTNGVNDNDQALNTTTGQVYQFVNGQWQLTGSIRGPQGLPGNDGNQGPIGPVGPVGPQGPQGERGTFVEMFDTLENQAQLEAISPESVPRYAGYLIPDETGAEHLWLIIGQGTEASPLRWDDAGSITGGGSTVTVDGAAKSSVEIGYISKISVNYEIGENTSTTNNGSEVTFTGLQTIGYNVENEVIEGESTIELPIANSDYIELDTSDGTTLKFTLSDEVWDEVQNRIDEAQPAQVQITAPTTSTSGTLTVSQLNTLQADKGAYLMFNNEVYRLQDTQHVSGYLVYSHVGYDNNTSVYMIKCITITISTRGWVLTTKQVQSQLTINGNTTTTSFYAPTTAGTSGYKLKSNGSGAPTWVQDLITTVNGSTTVGKTIYAPTSYGSTGYHLKANGSGVAPSWENPLSTLRSISISAAGANSGTFTLTIPTEDWNSSSTVMIIEGYLLYNNNTRGYRSMTIPVSRFKQYDSDTYRFGFSAYGDYRAEAYISGTAVSGTNTIVTITVGNSDRCYFSNIYLQR